ncbi:MAG: hypothetical protein ABI186_08310 [Candidatus Elarobacter sp.]
MASQIVIADCIVFFVLTVAAMLLYPGGRVGDVQSVGYAFFTNFFSDLGQTVTYGGHDNRVSLVLFCIALSSTAAAVGLFFIFYSLLFPPRSSARRVAIVAAVAGIIAAACFVGVAATPWNLYLRAHNDFVQWAFRSFLLAVVCAAIASGLAANFPRRFAAVFRAFAVLLTAYVLLLACGPSANTASGAAIQATGQKIIVYASMLTVLVQAFSVRALLRNSAY